MNIRPALSFAGEHWRGVSVSFLLLAVGFFSFREWGLPVVKRWLDSSMPSGKTVSLEKGFKDKFGEYAEYLGIQESVHLTFRDTTTEYVVEPVRDAPRGTGEFRIVPRNPARFDSTDIRKIISLVPAPGASGSSPSWTGETVRPNSSERSWTVRLENLSGDGEVTLSVTNTLASATIQVNLPNLFPVWNAVRNVDAEADRGRGRIVCEGPIGEFSLRPGRGIKHRPDLGRCGYRLLSVSEKTLWFQVVYSDADSRIPRDRWPDLRVMPRRLVNGTDYSRVVFESGKIVVPGEEGNFGDGYSIKLDEDGFLDNDGKPLYNDGEYAAVRFHYRDPDLRRVSDVIAVSRNTSLP